MRSTTLLLRRPVLALATVAALAGPLLATATPAFAAAGDISTVAGDGTQGYAGDGGPATAAQLGGPTSNALTPAGDILIADQINNAVRRVDHSTGIITTIAGDGTAATTGDGGPATAAEVNQPNDAEMDAAGNIYITEYGANVVRRIDHATGVISTFAGTGSGTSSGDGGPASAAGINTPVYVRFGPTGDMFVSSYLGHCIRRIDKATNVITTAVGICDTSGANGGDGGPATAATINHAYGFTFSPAGDLVFVDLIGNTVRKVDHTTGTVSRIAGTGFQAGDTGVRPALTWNMVYPADVIYDAAGNLFVAESGYNRVLRMDPQGYMGSVVGIGGLGGPGLTGDGGPALQANIYNPQAFSIDAAGNLYIADYGNNAIRKVTAPIPAPRYLVATNFDSDNNSDIAVYRPGASANWYVHPSAGGADTAVGYGTTGDVPVPGDYDGDLLTDQAIYRPSSGLWAIHNSSGGDTLLTFGGMPGDVPVPADYDYDGKADLGIFRPSTGVWYTHLSSDSTDHALMFGGQAGDIPVPADYNGDGFIDKAIFRPSTGTWWVHPSQTFEGDYGVNYGASGDIPVRGDYDGDGRTDVAVFRPSTGLWAIHYSSAIADTFVTYGGVGGDIPVPGDFDGDHRTDIAVNRPSLGAWYVHRSSNNVDAITTFGISGDIPLQLPYAVRHLFF